MGGGFGGSFGGGMGGGMRGGAGGRGAGGGGRPGGAGGARGGGGGGGAAASQANSNFSIGQQTGINTTNALGGQYTDTWGGGLNVEASYFFNLTDNKIDQITDRQYFLTPDTSQYYHQATLSDSRNYNHRLNTRFEYTIDPANEVIVTPRISFQTNNAVSNFNGLSWLQQNSPLSQSGAMSVTDVNGYTSTNSIVYRHKFDTPGRTISVQANANLNSRKSVRDLNSEDQYFSGASAQPDSLDQLANTRTIGKTFASNLTYTEPVGAHGLAQLNYALSSVKNSTDKKSFNYDYLSNLFDAFDPGLSNEVQSGYLTHHADLGYQVP